MNKSKTAQAPPAAQKGSQKAPAPTAWKDRISEQDYE